MHSATCRRRRIDEAFPHELRANTNEQEMFIRLKNGATWQVLGSGRYDAAVGSPPYGITFSEWALSNPASWAYLATVHFYADGPSAPTNKPSKGVRERPSKKELTLTPS